jgi:hypothetical protein
MRADDKQKLQEGEKNQRSKIARGVKTDRGKFWSSVIDLTNSKGTLSLLATSKSNRSAQL